MALVLLVAIATLGFRLLGKNASWLDAVYMVVISLTGVGYAEIVSTGANPLLRVFNVLVLIFGIGLMMYVFSLATAFIVEGELGHLVRRRKMQKKIEGFSRHVVVCGADETGSRVIRELGKSGVEVVAVDLLAERLGALGELPWLATVQGDATNPDVLEQCGIERASGLVATLPLDKDNLVITVMVRQKHRDVRIVARYAEPGMGDRILTAGADSTVSPAFIGGMRLASEMIRPHVVSFLDSMLREGASTLRIEEIAVPAGSPWAGSELRGLELHRRYGLSCLAVRDGEEGPFRHNPGETDIVRENTVLVVLGEVERVRAARQDARPGGARD